MYNHVEIASKKKIQIIFTTNKEIGLEKKHLVNNLKIFKYLYSKI